MMIGCIKWGLLCGDRVFPSWLSKQFGTILLISIYMKGQKCFPYDLRSTLGCFKVIQIKVQQLKNP